MNGLKVKNRQLKEENSFLKDRVRRLEHLLKLSNAETRKVKGGLRAELMTQNAILKKAAKEITLTMEEIKTAPEYVVRQNFDEDTGNIKSFTFVELGGSVTITEETV